MKRIQMFVLALLAVAMIYQGAAMADTVTGKVASVDSVAGTVTVTGAEGQDSVISATAEVLGDVKAGDEVSVEATQDAATGKWTASSVTKAAVAPAAEPVAAPAAPAAQ